LSKTDAKRSAPHGYQDEKLAALVAWLALADAAD
jgi:hypothetical protein